MWAIVTVRLPDGHVHSVRLRGSRKEAIEEVVQEARDTGYTKSSAERDDLRNHLESFGSYIDGDVRVEVLRVK